MCREGARNLHGSWPACRLGHGCIPGRQRASPCRSPLPRSPLRRSVLHTNPRNRDHIQYFNTAIKTVRVLVNTPASHGAIGDLCE